MAFKYTRNSTGNQGTFFQDDEVCKHGDFIKSPPPQLFTTQSSWKKRCFTLCKSSERCYTLKYLKGQQIKGFIAIDQISNIEIGISNYEKMTAVRKMFKCHPEEVLSINTESREYYLIGKDREQVEDWFTSLSSVRMKVKEDGRFAQVEDLADDKKRPHSDPGSRGLPEQQPRHSSPTRLLPSLNNNSEKTSINQLLLDSDENTRAEEEDYYASPSSILAQLESELSKSDPPVQSHNPMENEDHLCRKLYVSMKPLLPEEKLQPTCRSDEFLTLPRSQENSIDLRNCEADGNQQQLTQSSTNKQLTQERKPNVSSLSVVQLSIIINNVTDDSQLQEVDICIPHADVTSNLTLIEAAGQICVSHWKGPYRLGCIFHHGDHIVAVNDLRTQSIDEVSLFVSRSRRKEVKLTVRRIPDSDIFHIKGCSCS
ncbi:pleckstrin homology domain-containing family S member 1 isoform X3 [Gopherus flavomarginatus]|uniref:pleckstrin homology domain-containing family S member 1 isoform X3 n=1 Tax=Gopherus flavomarginatus TaxID=286002 RepID=UPI0021CBA74D|nr:pleckstrin homology domain-containing family S member 1 isoform X3 [Gopherus flavomarginatus]